MGTRFYGWATCLAAAAALLMAACGGGGSAGGETANIESGMESRLAAGSTGAAGPVRLTLRGAQVLDAAGQPLRLRGVNVEGVNEDDVKAIADDFHMNMIRLRISFTPDHRADNDTGLSKAYRDEIDQWVGLIKARKMWMVLEMRANDNVANDPDFYDITKTQDCDKPTTCANFGYYLKAWRYLAQRYKDTDYIAGYGLLAEPSANKLSRPDSHRMLLAFQRELMDQITKIDARTPFFVGPDYNYDTMEYVKDDYFDVLSPGYENRLVYEVNFLSPKEWIQNGSWTVETDDPAWKPTYPFADPANGYDSLLAGGSPGDSLEEIFNQQRVKKNNYPKTLSQGFIAWYLQWPLAFRERHHVPLYVDQFGASSEALGQLAYERDLIDFFEANDLHWTRWSYNAAGPDSGGRTLLPPNHEAIRFYKELGRHW